MCYILPQTFEEKLFATTPQKQMPDKKKKEQFKKLVQAIIGVSVCLFGVGNRFQQGKYALTGVRRVHWGKAEFTALE